MIRPNSYRLDSLITKLWERGTVGILEQDSQMRAYFPESVDLSGIVTPEDGEILESLFESESPTHPIDDTDSEPVYLGKHFVVVNGSAVYPSGLTALSLPSSDAFGSGRHESTQLMVEAMEIYLRPGSVVADVGCGSGILSEVAGHLEASVIIACDTHADAILAARQTCPKAAAFLGSVDAMESSTADLVLANISAKVIDVLAAELVRVTKPNGLLLLSGFIQDRTPERFRPEKVLELNGWLCWICRPELLASSSPETNQVIQPFEVQWW